MPHPLPNSALPIRVRGLRRLARSRSGFALIVAIGLMAFILLLVTLLTTLVQLETANATHTANIGIARENALFGLQVALGQLQQQLGPDQRVSATASFLDSDPETATFEDIGQPYWTGAWNSFEWDRSSDIDQPTPSGDASDGKPHAFRSWLVSGLSDPNLTAENKLQIARDFTKDSANAIEVVGEGTIGHPTSLESQYVYVPRETIQENGVETGGYAYWVGDEGVKVHYGHPQPDSTIDNYDKIQEQTHTGRANLNALENWNSLPEQSLQTDNVFENGAIQLNAETELGEGSYDGKFHAITPFSKTLLTDVRNGGLRRDLSLLFDEDTLPAEYENVPLFELDHETLGTTVLGPTWNYLKRYAKRYEMLRLNDADLPELNIIDVRPEIANALAPDKPNDAPLPVPVRVRYIFSLYKGYNTFDGQPYTPDPNAGSNDWRNPTPTDYQSNEQIVYLMMTPVYYYWNPYNVTLRMPRDNQRRATIDMIPSFPHMEFSFDGGSSYKRSDIMFWYYGDELISAHSSNNVGDDIVLPPGEVRLNSFNKLPYTAFLYAHYFSVWAFFGNVVAPSTDRSEDLIPEFEESHIGLFTPILKFVGNEELQGHPHDVGATQASRLLATGTGRIQVRFYENASRFTFKSALGSEGGATEREVFNTMQVDSPTSISASFLPSEYEHPELIDFGTLPSILDGNGNFTGIQPIFAVNMDIRAFDESEGLGKPGHYTDPANQYYYTRNTEDRDIATAPFRITFENLAGSGDYVQFDESTGRAFFKQGSNLVYSNVAKELPVAPLLSIAQLEHAPLGRDNQHLIVQHNTMSGPPTPLEQEPQNSPERRDMAPTFNRAVGNSISHPMIAEDSVWDGGYGVDRSYFLNDLLFDSYYFSGLAGESGPFASSSLKTADQLEAFLDGSAPLPNHQYQLYIPEGEDLASARASLMDGSTIHSEAYLRLAAFLAVEGGFNINSTSVDAWAALLSANQGKAVLYQNLDSQNLSQNEMEDRTPYLSKTIPAGAAAESKSDYMDANAALWSGYRALSDTEIRGLAEEIVAQVKARGPFLSLGEFYNREISDRDSYNKMGAIQAAIDASGLNTESEQEVLDDVLKDRFGSNTMDTGTINGAGLVSPESLYGDRNEGLPGYLTQAELLKSVTPVLSARSDTFIIRSYGDAKKLGKVVAKAWFEAVVQRVPDYVGNSNLRPWETPAAGSAAESFGRQFRIVSFRWLNEDEV